MEKFVSIETFNKFRVWYFKVKRDQRFGQAFLNRFYPDLACPEVFYETDPISAESLILNRFIRKVDDLNA